MVAVEEKVQQFNETMQEETGNAVKTVQDKANEMGSAIQQEMDHNTTGEGSNESNDTKEKGTWENAKDIVVEQASNLGDKVSGLQEDVKTSTQDMASNIQEGLSNAKDGLVNKAQDVGHSIQQEISNVVDKNEAGNNGSKDSKNKPCDTNSYG